MTYYFGMILMYCVLFFTLPRNLRNNYTFTTSHGQLAVSRTDSPGDRAD